MRDGERRVVVTGMGALTPVGNDVPSFWDGLVNGRSGIGRITLFDLSRVASQVAGELKGFDADTVMPKKEVRRNDRYVHYAWAASAEALRDAGLPNPIEDYALAWRTGVIIGSGIGGINTMIRDIWRRPSRASSASAPSSSPRSSRTWPRATWRSTRTRAGRTTPR